MNELYRTSTVINLMFLSVIVDTYSYKLNDPNFRTCKLKCLIHRYKTDQNRILSQIVNQPCSFLTVMYHGISKLSNIFISVWLNRVSIIV